MTDLFAPLRAEKEVIRDGVVLLSGFADSAELLPAIKNITDEAPFRHMVTPGGRPMKVAMTNAGSYGWVSTPQGYRYLPEDPVSGAPWPALPEVFLNLATRAAKKAGFGDFTPDACLINRYEPGTGLSPHQDLDEADKNWPIVSVSLGVSADFQLYGLKRGGSPLIIPLHDGDVLVFGGPSRLVYHGVKPLVRSRHPLTGDQRFNLTFRRAR
ncbi:DNA oxidative demethylase AlkB [Kordiimonas marina]|uniref:DNA oxidative demethylase AlkB n=1 Tax=Kordiimonas marina TaxID=2872312 RepID=UPI001FF467F3|nr:DNA oxidative demethylase AlkB [Kordiimonas marina]MCJ9429347.1 DNA oxidative demethylase AlkB [Kordiimonas marina]